MDRLRRVIADVESIATSFLEDVIASPARDLALERKLLRAASRARTAAATPLAAAYGTTPQWARSERATSPIPPARSTSMTIVLKRFVGRA
jgi:hypothetical protein